MEYNSINVPNFSPISITIMVNARKAACLNLVNTLLDLHRRQASGVVRLEAGRSKKQFVIRTGRLAFAESNQPEEHLARVMMTSKLIRPADLPRIRAAMKDGKRTDEAILATCGLPSSDLQAGARNQAVMIMVSVFPWEDYKLQIYQGDAFSDRRINLNLPLPDFLLETARRATAQNMLPASLRSPKGPIVRADEPGAGRLELPLDRSESYAYSLVAEPTTVEQAAPVLAGICTEPAKVLQCLLLLGLIRLQTPDKPDKAPASAARAALIIEEVDEMLRRFEIADLYEILSVPADASTAQIKAAYHELARKYHPDRFQSDHYSAEVRTMSEKLFTYITRAYGTLGDEASRRAYDESRMKQQSPIEAALQSQASAGFEKDKVAEVLFVSSRRAMVNGDFQKAVAQLKECVWLCPDSGKYHHYLGLAQSEIPRYQKEAESHLLKAIESNCSAIGSRIALGKLYMKVNLWRKARLQFEEALQWAPDNPEALALLASTEQETQETKNSRQ